MIFSFSGTLFGNLRRHTIIACFALVVIIFNGCGNGSKDTRHTNAAACILLFNGTGVSPNDVLAVETILDSSHLNYSTVNSFELDAMSRPQLMRYKLLIIPGGNFIDMGNSLTKEAAINIRYAVQHGLNYFGICAGGFLAGSSSYYNGFNLTSGVTFSFYSAENNGIHKLAVAITSPKTPTLDQYWEDGPQLSGWGMVVAKYPDGTPAVTEGKCGSGFVLVTGIHAEAPAGWRGGMMFNTPASADNAYAKMLIHTALKGTPLPHY